ncbi:hypothetical protein BC938DRAFT_483284 [Jimgerdemannia flammicorona]|uniref:Protein artemis n=1 Tax=Jimgerdemannia flammicorona TaxID=994334 RepID=A0A433QW17_9FUNG|nr:hypothetical protein BC938DRAFT_483284 [Jimgerdemannia flammicorona]
MSTFDGQCREYPAICIDNFEKARTACFLSHPHKGSKLHPIHQPPRLCGLLTRPPTDLLLGLDNPRFDRPVYCSEITAGLLPCLQTGRDMDDGSRTYAHLEPWLRPIPLMQPTAVALDDGESVVVTLLPSNHCPGAVMFLFEGDNGTVLYTGDFRADPAFLTKHEALCSTTTTSGRVTPLLRPVDQIYLDTTLCHDTYDTFPSKDNSILSNDPLTLSSPLSIPTRPTRPSSLTAALSATRKSGRLLRRRSIPRCGTIHVSPNTHALYTSLHPHVPHLRDVLTMSGATRFHSCDAAGGCTDIARRKKVVMVRPGAVGWAAERPQRPDRKGKAVAGGVWDLYGDCVRRSVEMDVRGGGCRECVNLLFATHSSLAELQAFVRLLRPCSIFPTVLDRDRFTHSNVVTRFRDACRKDPRGVDVITGREKDAERGKAKMTARKVETTSLEIGRKRKSECLEKSSFESKNEEGIEVEEGSSRRGKADENNVEMILKSITTTTAITSKLDDAMIVNPSNHNSISPVHLHRTPAIEDPFLILSSSQDSIADETPSTSDGDDCQVMDLVAVNVHGTMKGKTDEVERRGTWVDPIVLSDGEENVVEVGRRRGAKTESTATVVPVKETQKELPKWVKRLRRDGGNRDRERDRINRGARGDEPIVVGELLAAETTHVEITPVLSIPSSPTSTVPPVPETAMHRATTSIPSDTILSISSTASIVSPIPETIHGETTPLDPVVSIASSIASSASLSHPISLFVAITPSPPLHSPSDALQPQPEEVIAVALEQDSDGSLPVDMDEVESIRREWEETGRGPLLGCCQTGNGGKA